jgi:hypothetical protein
MHHQPHHQQSSIKGSSNKKKVGPTMTPTVPRMQKVEDVASHSCSSHPKPGTIKPDLILIGDVAFQQAPGAPSHFDAVVSTLLQFVDDYNNTLVMFGTRIRMPARVELLEMLLEHLEPVPGVEQPITVDEIEPLVFAHVKHNMSIHLLRRRKRRRNMQQQQE